MADQFYTGVATPGGASFVSPSLDFSTLGDLPKVYDDADKAAAARDQRNAFRNGIPKTSQGLPDYGAMADTLAKARAPVGDTLPLAEKAVYQPYVMQGLKEAYGPTPGAAPAAAPTGGSYDAVNQRAESGGNINAQNPNSSAHGLYQFLSGTWNDVRAKHPELNLPPTVAQATAEQQGAAHTAFTADNAAALKANGIQPNDRNLRMAHLLGADGAAAFLRGLSANPNAPATSLVSPDAARSNQSVFFDKNGQARTALDVFKSQTQQFAAATPAAGAPVALDASPTPPAATAPATAPQAPAAAPLTPAQAQQPRDMTLGGIVPQGTDPTAEYNRQRRISGNPFLPAPMREEAKARADAIATAMQKFNEPTPAQRDYQADKNPGETMSQYAARTAGMKTQAEDDVKSWQKKYDSAQALGQQAIPGIQKAELGMRMINDNNFYSGPFESTSRTFKQFAATLGIDPNKALPQETLYKITNDMLAEQVKAMGQSGVGRVLQTEVNTMRNSIASLGITPATNRLLLETVKRVYQHNADLAQLARNHHGAPGQINQSFDQKAAEYLQQHPLFTPEEMANPTLIAPPTFQTVEQMKAANLAPGSAFKVAGRKDTFYTK